MSTPDSLRIRNVKVDRLVPDPDNARTHSEPNLEAIRRSLTKFGQRKPIIVAPAADGRLVVIAGNGTLEAAKSLGWSEIAVADVPKDWDAETARAYAIADNRTAELAEWDEVKLSSTLLELDSVGWDIKDLGFETLQPPTDGSPEDLKNAYTAAINVPQYEIVGEQPAPSELYDETKTKELRDEILKAELDPSLREFLLAAAGRHTVFNYRAIAEFYPHASATVQRLIEQSALVIIDFEDAVRNGYVRLADAIEALEQADHNEA